jgi:hypothetical protein
MMSTFARPGPSQRALVPPSAASPFLPTSPHHHDAGDQSSDDEVPDFIKFATEGALDPISNRYFGKSAATKMIRRAVEMKSELTGGPLGLQGRRPEYWHIHSVSRSHVFLVPSSLRVSTVGTTGDAPGATHNPRLRLPGVGPTSHPGRRLLL